MMRTVSRVPDEVSSANCLGKIRGNFCDLYSKVLAMKDGHNVGFLLTDMHCFVYLVSLLTMTPGYLFLFDSNLPPMLCLLSLFPLHFWR